MEASECSFEAETQKLMADATGVAKHDAFEDIAEYAGNIFRVICALLVKREKRLKGFFLVSRLKEKLSR